MANCDVKDLIGVREKTQFSSTNQPKKNGRKKGIPNFSTLFKRYLSQDFEIKKAVLDAGAFGFTISGGGSSVIAICSDENKAKIADLMHDLFVSNPNYVETIITKTSNQGVREI